MTYTEAALVAVVVALLFDAFVVGTRLVGKKSFWIVYVIVLAFQLAVDGVLTGTRTVVYDPHAIVGLRVLNAPVEDIGFGFALVLCTVSWWVWLGRRS